eukprot:m.142610 g.142610  ORF g.142610 m.142610 type:complete len:223 (+) comp14882_c0_seq1:221-889(+)
MAMQPQRSFSAENGLSFASTAKQGTISNKERTQSIATENELACSYALWYSERSQRSRAQQEYSVNLIGRFSSVETFWSYFSHMIPAGEMQVSCDYHLFRDGIQPMWEDDANKNGGRFSIRLKKGLVSRFWENLVLAIIGGQFDFGEEICGAVVSVRFQDDVLSIWNKTSEPKDKNLILKIKEAMCRALSLPEALADHIHYQSHNDSAQKRRSSSYSRAPVGY